MKEEKKIIKYFDLFKFIDFLEGNMVFAKASIQKDEFEGTLPDKPMERIEEIYEKTVGTKEKKLVYEPYEKMKKERDAIFGHNAAYTDGKDTIRVNQASMLEKKSEEIKQKNLDEVKNNYKIKKCVGINCWRIGEDESREMWKEYAHKKYGVAIKSTVDKVKSELKSNDCIVSGEYTLIDIPITYEDYTKHDYEPENAVIPYKYKRQFDDEKSYDYMIENEYRFLIHKDLSDYEKANLDDVVKLQVCPDKIIDEIILAPDMQPWEREIIIKMVHTYYEKNELKYKIKDKLQDKLKNSSCTKNESKPKELDSQ